MCGRYYIASEDMEKIISGLLHTLTVPSPVKTEGEVFPGDTALIIAPNRKREARAFAMDWGFRLEKGKRLINARSESARSKPLFRDGMHTRRCLIPASFYYEWGQTDKAKYQFTPQTGPGICMAGIYRPEKDGRYAFTILTRDAAPDLLQVHPRMPVILPADALLPWLSTDIDPDTLLRRAQLDMTYAPAGQISLDKSSADRLY